MNWMPIAIICIGWPAASIIACVLWYVGHSVGSSSNDVPPQVEYRGDVQVDTLKHTYRDDEGNIYHVV